MSEPLISPEVDLRDFPYLPVDIAQLFSSAFHLTSTDREWRAGVTLWLRSLHEVPAGSLPSDDRSLSRLAELSPRTWKHVRQAALRGWVACADGRMYHPALVDRVNRAWDAKLRRLGRIDRRMQIESGRWAELRAAVYARDHFTCQYCGSVGGRLECDHVVPVSRGGRTEIQNLKTACYGCNRSKGSKMLEEWER